MTACTYLAATFGLLISSGLQPISAFTPQQPAFRWRTRHNAQDNSIYNRFRATTVLRAAPVEPNEAANSLQNLLLLSAEDGGANLGTALLTKAPILLLPVASLAAAQQALSQRDTLQGDASRTEEDLNSLKRQIDQNDSAITASFGAAALSSAVSLGVLLGAFDAPLSTVEPTSTVVVQEQVASSSAPAASSAVTSSSTPLAETPPPPPPPLPSVDVPGVSSGGDDTSTESTDVTPKKAASRASLKEAPEPPKASEYDSLMAKLQENAAQPSGTEQPQKKEEPEATKAAPSQFDSLMSKLQEKSAEKDEATSKEPAAEADETKTTEDAASVTTTIAKEEAPEVASQSTDKEEDKADSSVVAQEEEESASSADTSVVVAAEETAEAESQEEEEEAPKVQTPASFMDTLMSKIEDMNAKKAASAPEPAATVEDEEDIILETETDEFGNPVQELEVEEEESAQQKEEPESKPNNPLANLFARKDEVSTETRQSDVAKEEEELVVEPESDEFGNPVQELAQEEEDDGEPGESVGKPINPLANLFARKEETSSEASSPPQSDATKEDEEPVLEAESDEFGNPVQEAQEEEEQEESAKKPNKLLANLFTRKEEASAETSSPPPSEVLKEDNEPASEQPSVESESVLAEIEPTNPPASLLAEKSESPSESLEDAEDETMAAQPDTATGIEEKSLEKETESKPPSLLGNLLGKKEEQPVVADQVATPPGVGAESADEGSDQPADGVKADLEGKDEAKVDAAKLDDKEASSVDTSAEKEALSETKDIAPIELRPAEPSVSQNTPFATPPLGSMVTEGTTSDVITAAVGVAAVGVFAALVAAGSEDDDDSSRSPPSAPKPPAVASKPPISGAAVEEGLKTLDTPVPPVLASPPKSSTSTPASYMDQLSGSQPAKIKPSLIKKASPSEIKQDPGYLSALSSGSAPPLRTSSAPRPVEKVVGSIQPQPYKQPPVNGDTIAAEMAQSRLLDRGTIATPSSGGSYLERIAERVALSPEPPLAPSGRPPSPNGGGNFAEIKKRPSYSAFGKKPYAPPKPTFSGGSGGSYLETLGNEEKQDGMLPSINELEKDWKQLSNEGRGQ